MGVIADQIVSLAFQSTGQELVIRWISFNAFDEIQARDYARCATQSRFKISSVRFREIVTLRDAGIMHDKRQLTQDFFGDHEGKPPVLPDST